MNFNALDRYLDTFYREKNIPGTGISVYRYGKHLHTYCTGYANVEDRIQFAPDTMVNIYSATKISTCTTALKLIEQGKMKLDDPVSDYLPEMADVTVRNQDGEIVPVKNIMRIRHLFSMSAGFSYSSDFPEMKTVYAANNGNPTTRQFCTALSKTPLLFEPGTHFRYSYCHDVLGAVIEVAGEDRFSSILKKELFDPIGMTDTAFRLSDDQRKKLAPEYCHFNGMTESAEQIIWREGNGPTSNFESGGGGLLSCVKDYGLLAATLANNGMAPNGTRILKPETIHEMQTNQLNPEAMKDFDAMGGWSKAGYSYGLGVRTLINRERNNSLSENGEFGWDGALGCYLVADPKTGISIFYAQQERGSEWYKFHGTIRNFAYACILGSDE